MGGAIHYRQGAQARHLQAQDHRRQSLHQRLEHRVAMSLLPIAFSKLLAYLCKTTFLEYKNFSLNIFHLVFSDVQPLAATRGRTSLEG
jgi:hypothetical protein